MIKVRQVNHVNITVGDLERTRRFYEGVLGLPTIPRPSARLRTDGEWYQLGDKQLHISVRPDEPPPASSRHVAIEVEDFDEVLRVLAEHRVPLLDADGAFVS